MKRGEKAIFTEDVSGNLDNFLESTLVKAIVDFGITYDEFAKRHSEYRLNEGWTSSSRITSDRNNLLKPLLIILQKAKTGRYDARGKKHPSLTYKTFETIFKNILQLNISNVAITFKDINNKTYVINNDVITY